MWSFIRRQANYFFIGFIVTFVAYLFARFDNDDVLYGVVLAALGGFVLSVVIFLLERRFPERRDGPPKQD